MARQYRKIGNIKAGINGPDARSHRKVPKFEINRNQKTLLLSKIRYSEDVTSSLSCVSLGCLLAEYIP